MADLTRFDFHVVRFMNSESVDNFLPTKPHLNTHKAVVYPQTASKEKQYE